jgi:hypothetical protein
MRGAIDKRMAPKGIAFLGVMQSHAQKYPVDTIAFFFKKLQLSV